MTGERVCVKTNEVGSMPIIFRSSDTLDAVARSFHHDRSSSVLDVKTTGGGGLFIALPLDTELARLRDEGDLEGDGSGDNPFIVQVERADIDDQVKLCARYTAHLRIPKDYKAKRPAAADPGPGARLSKRQAREGREAGTPEGLAFGVPVTAPRGGPEAGARGGPEADAPGGPEPGARGGPEADAPGDPEAGAHGGPEADAPGGPELGARGGPEADAPGGPEPGARGGPEADAYIKTAAVVVDKHHIATYQHGDSHAHLQPGAEVQAYVNHGDKPQSLAVACSVLKVSPSINLALLKVKDESISLEAPVLDLGGLAKGRPYILIGQSAQRHAQDPYTYGHGSIATTTAKAPRICIQGDTLSGHGDSGGGIFSAATCALIGMCVGRDQQDQKCFILPTAVIASRIEAPPEPEPEPFEE